MKIPEDFILKTPESILEMLKIKGNGKNKNAVLKITYVNITVMYIRKQNVKKLCNSYRECHKKASPLSFFSFEPYFAIQLFYYAFTHGQTKTGA